MNGKKLTELEKNLLVIVRDYFNDDIQHGDLIERMAKYKCEYVLEGKGRFSECSESFEKA